MNKQRKAEEVETHEGKPKGASVNIIETQTSNVEEAQTGKIRAKPCKRAQGDQSVGEDAGGRRSSSAGEDAGGRRCSSAGDGGEAKGGRRNGRKAEGGAERQDENV
jgi:hypothetical protein